MKAALRVKVGQVVRVHAADCCLEVKGQGVVDAVDVDEDGNFDSITINGITIFGVGPNGIEVIG